MNLSIWNQIHPYLDVIIDIGTLLLFLLILWITKRLLAMEKELKKIKKELEKIDSTFVSYLSMLDEENMRLKRKQKRLIKARKP